MNKRQITVAGGSLLALVAIATIATFFVSRAPAVSDPRQQPPLVKLVSVTQANGNERTFTGTIGARVQSNLAFRVSGKIVARLVNTGQEVKAGQPLMRIDQSDLRLALSAKRSAIAVARASSAQAAADEKRYANLLNNGAVSRQAYEQTKTGLDTAQAQLAVAEAEAQFAANEVAYSVLVADTSGTVVETLGEPGQVVAAGQTVVRIAAAGPREAVIALPEAVRPVIGSTAQASVYGRDNHRYTAHLRQLSDSADAQTRTYEARYVLDGDAAAAPLGATVTVRLSSQLAHPETRVPLGAVFDDGRNTGVWTLDRATSSVRFRAVKIIRVHDETAVVSGLNAREPIVAIGAHLLQEGARVRTASDSRGNK